MVSEKILESPWTVRRWILSIHWKDWCWSWNSCTLGTWCEELTHLKRHWCWERLKAGAEWHDRGWDGWMALPTQWAWVWVSSGCQWWTGKPDVLRSMGLQRVQYAWATELNLSLTCRISLKSHRYREWMVVSGTVLLGWGLVEYRKIGGCDKRRQRFSYKANSLWGSSI